MTLSDIRRVGKAPTPFDKEHLAEIREKVKKFREEMDVPFDEIYHKERKLVHDIIKAQKAIQAIEEKLPNPIEGSIFNPEDIDEDPVYGDMYS